MTSTASYFPSDYFRRRDETDDREFYVMPRLVVHIDEPAIAALAAQLAAPGGIPLPAGGVYLDLMSSWRSHLPPDLAPARVVGLGMNALEMAENPQLDAYIVHDLNRAPALPFGDGEFDATLCTVSVQYLTHPIEVFCEVYRVLKPGGVFVVSFSNRCFPSKAIAAWLVATDAQRIQLVEEYFAAAGGWTPAQMAAHTPAESDPLYVVWSQKPLEN
jgi:SAM-dependent methyltransferase